MPHDCHVCLRDFEERCIVRCLHSSDQEALDFVMQTGIYLHMYAHCSQFIVMDSCWPEVLE